MHLAREEHWSRAAISFLLHGHSQPHLKAVGLFEELEHPTEGKIRQARPPAHFSASPAGVRRLAPRLGEHTREVLHEVGYGEAEIEGLVEKRVIGVG